MDDLSIIASVMGSIIKGYFRTPSISSTACFLTTGDDNSRHQDRWQAGQSGPTLSPPGGKYPLLHIFEFQNPAITAK